MSIGYPHPMIKFVPFHAILQDRIDRLLEFIPDGEFTFIVRSQEWKMTWFESVLTFPLMSPRLKSDPRNHFFIIR
jgi:hypothetical protein